MRDKRIHLLKQYITENLQQEFSVEQLAAKVDLSPSYLAALFKKETGFSPIRFIITLRLDEAKKLLDREDFPHINEIAKRVGYFDLNNFIREFKKTYGTSPKEYWKNNEVKK